ncbi:MAG: YbjN domain-containing protein [Anaerolineae bacterium]|nr:YbjN domain-containing protein [Anaerolineae bacterium]
MSEILTDQQMSIEALENLFRAAFLQVERDKDGDLLVRDESGVKTIVKLDPDKKLASFFAIWGLTNNFNEAAKLKFVNDLNNDLIMVRFSLPRADILWCDYQFLYEGGVVPFQVVITYRRFVSVCRSAVQKAPAGLIS